MKKRLLLSTFMLFVTSNTFTQTYTEIFEGGWGNGMTFSVPTFTDFNSDGKMDLIVGNQGGKLKHYEQDAIGSSTFTLISDSFNGIDVGEFATPGRASHCDQRSGRVCECGIEKPAQRTLWLQSASARVGQSGGRQPLCRL